MAKLNLNDVTNLSGNPTSAEVNVNANSALIEAALENTVSRDGTAPNAMGANLDLNSNRVTNLAPPSQSNDAARLVDLADSDATGAASARLRLDLSLTDNGKGAGLVALEDSASLYTGETLEVALSELLGTDPGIVYRTRQLLKGYSETIVIDALVTGNYEIDVSAANIYRLTLVGNTTLSFANWPAAGESSSVVVRVIQDITGSRSLTMPAEVVAPSATPISLTTAAGTRSKLVFDSDDGGVIVDVQLAGDNYG